MEAATGKRNIHMYNRVLWADREAMGKSQHRNTSDISMSNTTVESCLNRGRGLQSVDYMFSVGLSGTCRN